MSVYKITFSPAGGTVAVANALCTVNYNIAHRKQLYHPLAS